MKALHLLVGGSLIGVAGLVPQLEAGREAGREILLSGRVLAASPPIAPVKAGLSARRETGAYAPLATIVGTVKDEAGEPLIGAIVALLEPHARGKELQSVRTDTKGKFAATIAPGAYRLRATAAGFSSLLTRVQLDRSGRVTYDFALKRTDTLVFKRGDSDDYRWIARSVPRQILKLLPGAEIDPNTDADLSARRATFRGMAQFLMTPGVPRGTAGILPGQNFYGTNFAMAGGLDGRIEVALIGQRGAGVAAPQRLTAIASMRTAGQQETTATISYGQFSLRSPFTGLGSVLPGETLNQLSISSSSSWQLTDSLLVVYGLDYATFIGSAAREHESLLPQVAIQYLANPRWRLHGGVTPGRQRARLSLEAFRGETIEQPLETVAPEIAFADQHPLVDHSRRYEAGVERLFDGGSGSIGTTLFYDQIDGHGVGLSPFFASGSLSQITAGGAVPQVRALHGNVRGGRVVIRRALTDRITATLGYSAGHGRHVYDLRATSGSSAGNFHERLFQVATGQVDLDLVDQTGTRISTVLRLTPSPLLFAIDPFAGQMGVYDPTLNLYVTQDLPSLGLPIQWQAIVDLRNLLNQAPVIEEGGALLLATRSSRIIRGGVAFRW